MGRMDNARFDLLVRALETGLGEKLFNSRLNFLNCDLINPLVFQSASAANVT